MTHKIKKIKKKKEKMMKIIQKKERIYFINEHSATTEYRPGRKT